MTIELALCNFTQLARQELEAACVALEQQLGVATRLHGTPADAVIYLWEHLAEVPFEFAEDSPHASGLPYGFVILEVSELLEEPWCVTLMREARMVIDDVRRARGATA